MRGILGIDLDGSVVRERREKLMMYMRVGCGIVVVGGLLL